MERIDIDIGTNGDGFDSHTLCRADNPASDLATVSDQYF
jgi:hypothetical protein